MDADAFRNSPCGRVVPTIKGAWAYVPHPLPPPLDYSSLISILDRASMAVGELRGMGYAVPNPYLLIRPLQRKEAVASSRIEGTTTELSELLLLEEGVDDSRRPSDTREVLNYVRALVHAISRLGVLPVSSRLMNEAHAILMQDVAVDRGAKYPPGEFRRDQNWIGLRGVDIKDARFVPPPVGEMTVALAELEKYANKVQADDTPDLIRAALIHYQFEAIHPYPDGNGRIGRLLIPLYLAQCGVLPQPLLYLSPFFERNRDEYLDRLLSVSRDGDWLGWIRFFLRGVIQQSGDAIIRMQKLRDLQSAYREKLHELSASGLPARLIDHIFERPFVSVPIAMDVLRVTYPTAKAAIDRLVEAGVLDELKPRTKPKFFLAREVYRVIEANYVEGDEKPRRRPSVTRSRRR
ncbi:MAG: Fic family protein [Alphaproteobacteria bacterium]